MLTTMVHSYSIYSNIYFKHLNIIIIIELLYSAQPSFFMYWA